MIRATRGPLLILLLAAATATLAYAHPAPNSTLRLDFDSHGVRGEYWLPASELALARAGEPDRALADYLLRRLAARGPDGRAWRVTLRGIREDRYLDHDYLVAELRFAPPAGASPRPFVLTGDVITHEVRNHVVFVVENRADGNRLIGALQYPARELAVPGR